MRYSIYNINRELRRDPAAFAEKCEAEYSERVNAAAEAILENVARSPIILLSGPSGAGKTTTAKRLEDVLDLSGIECHTISLDNYFKTLDPATAPRTPEGEVDYESPELLDMELLNEHFDALSNRKEIKIPYFVFTRQKRSVRRFTRLRLKENEIAIFEGIHALNDAMTDKNPDAFTLYISAMAEYRAPDGSLWKPEWTRLLRRMVRDMKFRGTDAKSTVSLWENIMRGERANIDPFVPKAKLRLDSTLAYELPLLRNTALELLKTVTEGMPGYEEVSRLVPLLERFLPADESVCPKKSLLREFIGGGAYTY